VDTGENFSFNSRLNRVNGVVGRGVNSITFGNESMNMVMDLRVHKVGSFFII
jgi:hypothetical protein